MYRTLLLLLLTTAHLTTVAQTVPVGHWREHLPYRQVTAIAVSPATVYCAANYGLFSVTVPGHEITRYSKLSGLHDAGISTIAYHDNSAALVVGYRNGNIDILQRENIINIPDLLRKQVNGDKSIYHISFFQDNALLCTGFGVMVLDLGKKQIAATWYPGNGGNFTKVSALAHDDTWWYAATAEGLKRAPLQGANLANYESWQAMEAMPVSDIAAVGNTVIGLRNGVLYRWQQTAWQPWGPGGMYHDISVSGNLFTITAANQVMITNTAGIAQSTLQPGGTPLQALNNSNITYIADSTRGLVIHDNDYTPVYPNAPDDITLGDLLVAGNTLWGSAGAVTANWQATGRTGKLFKLENEEWTNYEDLPADLVTLAYTPQDNKLWAGSFGGGLVSMPDKTIFKQPYIDAALNDLTAYRVSGAVADNDGNLWLACYGANRNLALRKKDGSWQNFIIPYFLGSNAVGQVLVDDYNQKWIVAPRGNGLIVYNHGANIDLPADDKWFIYQSGAGRGNLPTDDVRCVAKDKSGYIWIGTAMGVAVVQCAQQATAAQGCEAYIPILQQGNFAGYLFRNEQVNTIAVDGADRKWVGTQNGVWLISPAGDKIIEHFNMENSPLLSNEVRKIVVHPRTGEVFFATGAGLLSYRGTATEGGTTHNKQEVLVFPNPVPPGYGGTIAIRGLVSNALVKITDISGRLVFQTRAQGGQAVWSGQDYTGHRPQSGVYLVFSSDDTGAEKLVTKIVFIH